MTDKLNVYMLQEWVGHLYCDAQGQLHFTYASSWLSNPQAIAISFSLPLQQQTFSTQQCLPFFAGLLPEMEHRRIIARHLGISPHNDFKLLDKIGGECAGAISFFAQETEPHFESKQRYRPVSDKQLYKMMKDLSSHPLLAGQREIRLSLAGAQEKMAVAIDHSGQISIPLLNSPSTHILKPQHFYYSDLIENEYFCMNIAKAIGLNVAPVAIGEIDGNSYLLIERYDRYYAGNGALIKQHQEDFCQALGIHPENKYQNEGGPSLKQCFQLIRDASDLPIADIDQFLDAIAFNFYIGNHDAHGKNFSFIYGDEGIRLAPLYDLVSTLPYPSVSRKMSMKLGGEYNSEHIYERHIERLASEINLHTKKVKQHFDSVHQRIVEYINVTLDSDSEVIRKLCNAILQHCQQCFKRTAVACHGTSKYL